jgi:hypothetical protein
MRKLLGLIGGLGLLMLLPAQAANIPLFTGPNCSEASQLLSCLNQLIVQLNGQTYTQSLAEFNNPRNLLDNGAMQVDQRGTGARTCALNGAAITSAAYSADRWGCEVNVGSGAGQLTVINATPTPPPGFQNAEKLVRNSGALTQPQCAYQEIPAYKVAQVAGQQVVLSGYQQALAGLAADQGSTTQSFNLVIITGTTADQGFGTWTASPAITPAWAGVATQVNTNFITPVTPSWQRYQTTAFIPLTALEIAVGICFTPTAAGQSATDGIAFTGIQLEQGSVASPYEFQTPARELVEAERYFWRVTEDDTALSAQSPLGSAQGTTTTCSVFIPFPVTMRTAPTYTNALTASTFTITSDSQAATALGTPFSATLGANSVNGASINFTTTGMTAKDACWLTSTAAGVGVMDWTADF